MGHQKDKSRTEDLTTDQRAHRHPNKSANYTEDAQNVRNDNVGNIEPLAAGKETDHARNKANQDINESED